MLDIIKSYWKEIITIYIFVGIVVTMSFINQGTIIEGIFPILTTIFVWPAHLISGGIVWLGSVEIPQLA